MFCLRKLIVKFKFANLPFSKYTTTGTSVKVGLPSIVIFASPLNIVLLSYNVMLSRLFGRYDGVIVPKFGLVELQSKRAIRIKAMDKFS